MKEIGHLSGQSDQILTAKNNGLSIIACSEKSKKIINDIHLNKPTLIIIGSEKDGISAKLLQLIDEKVKIPIYGKTASLNAAVAAGIILFECCRQRNTN